MKKIKNLSLGTKIFVAFESLMMLLAAICTLVLIIEAPVWKSSVLDGAILSTILVLTIGLVEWLFIEILLDTIK